MGRMGGVEMHGLKEIIWLNEEAYFLWTQGKTQAPTLNHLTFYKARKEGDAPGDTPEMSIVSENPVPKEG